MKRHKLLKPGLIMGVATSVVSCFILLVYAVDYGDDLFYNYYQTLLFLLSVVSIVFFSNSLINISPTRYSKRVKVFTIIASAILTLSAFKIAYEFYSQVDFTDPFLVILTPVVPVACYLAIIFSLIGTFNSETK